MSKITRKRELYTELGSYDEYSGGTTTVLSSITSTKCEVKVIQTNEVDLLDREEVKARVLDKLKSRYKGKAKGDVRVVVTGEELVHTDSLPWGTKDYLDGGRFFTKSVLLALEVEISFEESPKATKKKAEEKQKRIKAAEAKLRKAQKALEKLKN